MSSPGWAKTPIDAIRRFEQLAPRVWPPAETQSLDGWLLCFAGGCTKRANSVQSLGGLAGDLAARVERCEAIYRELGQKVVFKLTEASRPLGLDALLEARGYEVVEPTSVQLRCEPATRVVAAHQLDEVAIESESSDGWSAACMAINRVAPEMHAALRGIMQRIEQGSDACAFASISREGEIVAQGVGVLLDAEVCLCEIATDPAARRQGLAAAIVSALCRWADAHGAAPWLQVVAANERAVPLYHSLGFREMYRHWYRVRA